MQIHFLRVQDWPKRASILYNDSSSEELVFFIENVCYRFPNVSGIAGFCLQTGESLNIEDAYKDKRFNKEIDKKLWMWNRKFRDAISEKCYKNIVYP